MATLRARSLLFDTAIAAVALAMSLGAMGHGGWNRDHTGSAGHRLDALGVALALAMALPLVARRIWPVPVLAVVAPATGALYALDYGFPPVAFAVALYTVARWPDGTRAAIRNAVLAGSVAVLLVPSLARHGFGPGVFAGTVVWALAWFAGDRMRQRHERIASAAERARQAEREAERERRLASAEERTRIARDLHDSAGHAVNVILVQAGAARLLLEQDPARSRAALRTIEDVARETLVEIDQLVRALRDPGGTDGVEPPAGLAALDTLVARSRSAGLDVEVEETGERRALPRGIDQAAYRILREALTNASRHGAGTARVELRYGASALELVVTNPLRAGVGEGREGHGIVGMRERAALVDGTLEALPEDGSFRVRATLPYREAS
ncbi:MAG TPA: histidine kinase [Gaiella sp.]|nr:histidine kinase [Gaiella sp.]